MVGFIRNSDGFEKTTKVSRDTWLQINLSGEVQDYNEVESGLGTRAVSVQEICHKVSSAAKDSKVKGIVLNPNFAVLSLAGVNEIQTAIGEFKKSGKPVLAHLDMQSQKDYQIAALADTIAMEPSQAGGLFLSGVSANVTFYKNLLDKLGLKVHIIRSGSFKGYGENYSRTAMSAETYENISRLLENRYELSLAYLMKQRKLDAAQVKAIFETRADYIINADYALQAGLIDVKIGRDEFYRQHKIEKDHLISIKEYQPAETMTGTAGNKKNKIAVVYLQGGISANATGQMGLAISADKVQTQIDAIVKDPAIKAVVLRINSPGGSALESEIIYRKLADLRQNIPVVVSMSGVAASGGYYISAASNYIVADPYTVTGSIGVIQLLPDASNLSNKIGISDQTIGFGKYSDAMNIWNTPSPELLASLQRNSTNVYNEFKSRVAVNRKLDLNAMDAIAEGRVWCARDALANGLIDQIGNLDVAIRKAASLSKLTAWQTVTLPRPKPYFSVIMEQLSERYAALKLNKSDSFTALLQKQIVAIGLLPVYLFAPYTTLCIMPFTLD